MTDAILPRVVPAPARTDRRRTGLIELALAVGGFAIGTGEFATMGFLPDLARTLDISEPTAGHVISAYALGVVVGSPIIAVLAAKLHRRTLLIGLMGVFALGNLLSALAPGYHALLGLRFLTGMPHGAYFGVASLVAASLAPAGGRARAVGRVMMGLTIATVVGTPLVTLLGQSLGWRLAFAGVGGVGLLTVLLVALFVPTSSATASSPLVELGALRRPQVWLTLGVAAVGSGGVFAIYTYVSSTLTQVAGLPLALVPAALVLFGLGMTAGNVVGSKLADRALMPAIAGVLAWDAAVGAVYACAAHNPWTAAEALFLVGCGFAILPGLQTRLMDVAADAQTLAAALNHSAFNVANALGAWLGGITVAAGYGWTSTGSVAAALPALGLAVFGVSAALERRAKA
ncbi:MFS transporter [Lichenibacterium dinghuense]|uniref:MFS transporter n=1 Tax=Lichenibacterium dinghuense TaxID=2895977 RepID=UPI001F227BED|nr:MFS transporter [Lichenibacterium sp. 6Y81]